ncbi:hypothetical protein BLNAU_2841 [Blattamonas nauphoetae]|uniref:Uncharacterized protein n=1 Tax=Blattamonas nauphoetae TaxID=2049346 RepID=A0ABQ9YEX7_9EUKA|nr:hypothetical protein BLNAU_2841 [Blattamonas nauphoetae]
MSVLDPSVAEFIRQVQPACPCPEDQLPLFFALLATPTNPDFITYRIVPSLRSQLTFILNTVPSSPPNRQAFYVSLLLSSLPLSNDPTIGFWKPVSTKAGFDTYTSSRELEFFNQGGGDPIQAIQNPFTPTLATFTALVDSISDIIRYLTVCFHPPPNSLSHTITSRSELISILLSFLVSFSKNLPDSNITFSNKNRNLIPSVAAMRSSVASSVSKENLISYAFLSTTLDGLFAPNVNDKTAPLIEPMIRLIFTGTQTHMLISPQLMKIHILDFLNTIISKFSSPLLFFTYSPIQPAPFDALPIKTSDYSTPPILSVDLQLFYSTAVRMSISQTFFRAVEIKIIPSFDLMTQYNADNGIVKEATKHFVWCEDEQLDKALIPEPDQSHQRENPPPSTTPPFVANFNAPTISQFPTIPRLSPPPERPAPILTERTETQQRSMHVIERDPIQSIFFPVDEHFQEGHWLVDKTSKQLFFTLPFTFITPPSPTIDDPLDHFNSQVFSDQDLFKSLTSICQTIEDYRKPTKQSSAMITDDVDGTDTRYFHFRLASDLLPGSITFTPSFSLSFSSSANSLRKLGQSPAVPELHPYEWLTERPFSQGHMQQVCRTLISSLDSDPTPINLNRVASHLLNLFKIELSDSSFSLWFLVTLTKFMHSLSQLVPVGFGQTQHRPPAASLRPFISTAFSPLNTFLGLVLASPESLSKQLLSTIDKILTITISSTIKMRVYILELLDLFWMHISQLAQVDILLYTNFINNALSFLTEAWSEFEVHNPFKLNTFGTPTSLLLSGFDLPSLSTHSLIQSLTDLLLTMFPLQTFFSYISGDTSDTNILLVSAGICGDDGVQAPILEETKDPPFVSSLNTLLLHSPSLHFSILTSTTPFFLITPSHSPYIIHLVTQLFISLSLSQQDALTLIDTIQTQEKPLPDLIFDSLESDPLTPSLLPDFILILPFSIQQLFFRTYLSYMKNSPIKAMRFLLPFTASVLKQFTIDSHSSNTISLPVKSLFFSFLHTADALLAPHAPSIVESIYDFQTFANYAKSIVFYIFSSQFSELSAKLIRFTFQTHVTPTPPSLVNFMLNFLIRYQPSTDSVKCIRTLLQLLFNPVDTTSQLETINLLITTQEKEVFSSPIIRTAPRSRSVVHESALIPSNFISSSVVPQFLMFRFICNLAVFSIHENNAHQLGNEDWNEILMMINTLFQAHFSSVMQFLHGLVQSASTFVSKNIQKVKPPVSEGDLFVLRQLLDVLTFSELSNADDALHIINNSANLSNSFGTSMATQLYPYQTVYLALSSQSETFLPSLITLVSSSKPKTVKIHQEFQVPSNTLDTRTTPAKPPPQAQPMFPTSNRNPILVTPLVSSPSPRSSPVVPPRNVNSNPHNYIISNDPRTSGQRKAKTKQVIQPPRGKRGQQQQQKHYLDPIPLKKQDIGPIVDMFVAEQKKLNERKNDIFPTVISGNKQPPHVLPSKSQQKQERSDKKEHKSHSHKTESGPVVKPQTQPLFLDDFSDNENDQPVRFALSPPSLLPPTLLPTAQQNPQKQRITVTNLNDSPTPYDPFPSHISRNGQHSSLSNSSKQNVKVVTSRKEFLKAVVPRQTGQTGALSGSGGSHNKPRQTPSLQLSSLDKKPHHTTKTVVKSEAPQISRKEKKDPTFVSGDVLRLAGLTGSTDFIDVEAGSETRKESLRSALKNKPPEIIELD